jgi:hypothetical protein
MLQRGIDNTEFRPEIDIEAALDALYSPFYASWRGSGRSTRHGSSGLATPC